MYFTIFYGLYPSFFANNYAKLSTEKPQLSREEANIIFLFYGEK